MSQTFSGVKMKKQVQLLMWGVAMLSAAWSAEAAVCTTNAGTSGWGTASTWSCGHVPLATDTVVITRDISLAANRTVAGVTVNAGATLSGGNRNLTVSGPVIINGIYNTGGGDLTTTGGGALTVNAGGTFDFNNGNAAINGNVAVNGTLSSGGDNIQMTGAGTVLSGTGNIANTTIEIDAAGVSVPAGANLVFDANSEIDVGANNAGSLTVNGTIDGTAQAARDRIIRVSNGGALTVGTTGVVNAPNSRLDVRDGATVTNNGTITIGDLRGRNRTPAPVFTQGANSTLNINLTACDAANPCTFNASAAGNTVNYSGAAQTVLTPSGATYANLTISGSGVHTVPTGLTVTENFTMSGTATVTAPAALAVGGDFTIGAGNTFTPGAGTVTLIGTAAQTISGNSPLNFNNLTVTNAANPNITLTTNVNVTGTLSGTVNLTSTCPTDFTLTYNAGASVAHGCSIPHVASINLGSINPTNPATVVTWTVTFDMSVTGVDSTDFALVSVGGVTGAAITGVAGSGTIWTVTANTGSGTGTLGLNLVDNDSIVSGGRPLGGIGAGNGNFTGAIYTVEAAMTCLTDTFSTGTLDPSLWTVRTIMGAFTPQVVDVGGGDFRLRLTDTGGNEATFAQLKSTFPGAGNKVVMEIDYFAYGGTGADGIAVTFSDSAISSTTGGFGGSLGYAPNGTNDGFGGGWLGIGLDEYGNFPNPTEGRSGYPAGWTAPVTANSAAGFYKTNVSVRGSGSAQTGYALLANTGVLATAVAPPTGAAGDTPYRFRFTLDHSDNVHAYVTVERDTTGTGGSYATLVPQFDVKGPNSGQAAVPANWLVSFTGSTGGATNNHEFKRVRVCANTILGVGPHHFEIQHADGQGVTCTPSTLTIKACADNAVPCTPYTAGVSGNLSATGTPTVNWGGGSNAFTIPAGSSSVTHDIQVTTVGSVTLDATSTPAPSAVTTCSWGACTFTSADSALLVSAPNHLAESASTLTIQAVKSAPGNPLVCVPGMTGTKTLNLKCGYTNPASGTQAVRVGGTALNAGNDAAAACDAGGANVSLTFNASGIATPSLQYADVGQMNVSASYSGTSGSMDAGLVMTGSGSFITAPASFSVTGVTAGPIIAGSQFSATVTALNAAGNATANFGKEAEGVTLDRVLAMGAGTWASPALGGTTVIPGASFVNGAATVSNLTWAEVGAINLDAALTSGDYLASGLTTSGATAAPTTFIPDHYTTEIVSAGGVPMTCPDASCPVNILGTSGMVYSGQPFSVKVTAKNLAGATTVNYHDAFAQGVTLSGVGAAGTLSNPLILASNFTLGAGTTTSLPAFTFSAAGPAAPADIIVRATGTGVSATAQSSGADESALKVAYGRINLPNAYGSELLPLTLGVSAQYYGTSGWTNSLTDNATILGLAASYAVGTGSTSPTPQNGTMSGGILSVRLSKPGVEGVATIMPSAHPYMGLVAGTVTFGVYGGAPHFIYQREAY
ncbi:MAG: hypothetical protein KKF58_02855 [Gammaproteobacteria bacterium]|nr:hypothetical protein [Gammaproteobacteria bacterium]MBU1447229.1 hypothetical protein [Gammaproteobacteria bacterium]